MLLTDIKRIISEKGEVCASEICTSLGVDRGLVELALSQLAAMGVITEAGPDRKCSGCLMNCSIKGEKFYRML